MISVNFNPSVIKSQNNLSFATNTVSETLERMSTGYKVNRAADDAAGLYISTKMNRQINGLKIAQTNIENGLSILNIADSSLGDITSLLQRVRDLAVQGANGVYDETALSAMQAEADALVEEIFRIKDSALFNKMNVFSGNAASAISAASWQVNGSGGQNAAIASISNSPPPRK